MPITLMCPNLKCRHILNVPDSARGKKVRCGNCGTMLAVPTGVTVPVPEPEEPQDGAEQAE